MSSASCKHRSMLSSRAKRATCIFLAGYAIVSATFSYRAQALASDTPKRPHIVAIAMVTIRSTHIPEANDFYRSVILPESVCSECKRPNIRLFGLASGQKVELLEASESSANLLSNIAFVTEDLETLRRYLSAKGIRDGIVQSRPGPRHAPIITHDPEGHQISFVEYPYMMSASDLPSDYDLVSARRIIHAGFVVHDRAAEDKFYKDILGFHVYWHGGMKDGEDNWVDMQVPDGSDWIEYMLGVAPDASHKTLGVMNHIALGVPDIHKAREQLVKNGWKGTEEPKIGRDGKWQLNLYDPDETRV